MPDNLCHTISYLYADIFEDMWSNRVTCKHRCPWYSTINVHGRTLHLTNKNSSVHLWSVRSKYSVTLTCSHVGTLVERGEESIQQKHRIIFQLWFCWLVRWKWRKWRCSDPTRWLLFNPSSLKETIGLVWLSIVLVNLLSQLAQSTYLSLEDTTTPVGRTARSQSVPVAGRSRHQGWKSRQILECTGLEITMKPSINHINWIAGDTLRNKRKAIKCLGSNFPGCLFLLGCFHWHHWWPR